MVQFRSEQWFNINRNKWFSMYRNNQIAIFFKERVEFDKDLTKYFKISFIKVGF